MIFKDKNGLPKTRYTRIDNNVFQDKKLSLAGIGLYCILSYLPEDWKLSVSGLMKCHNSTPGEIRKTLNELIESGYLKREQSREGGRFCGCDYRIYDLPHTVKPDCGLSECEKPECVNRTQYNKGPYKNRTIQERKEKESPSGDYGDVEF